MSVSTESTASSEDPGLLEKVFLAGCRKNFVGRKRDQFSRNEITTMNIVRLLEQQLAKLEEISDIDRYQFSEKITIVLGASRIREKAVTFLLEDLIKFNAELDELLSCQAIKKSSKPKKAKRTKENATGNSIENQIEDLEIDLESILSWKHIENYDIEAELQRGLGTDKHLLNEIDISYVSVELPPFGDEIHLQRDRHKDHNYNEDREVEIPDADTSHEAPERSSRQTPSTLLDKRATRDGSHSVTPKRRTNRPHDETPTKRQRKSQGHADSSISRNLFGPDKPSSSMPPEDPIRQVADQQEVQPLDENFPNEDFQAESHPNVSHSDIEGVQDLPQDQEPEELPAPVSSQNVQQLPDMSLANLNDMQLEDLDDQSLISQRRRRARVIADEKTMLPKPSIMINKKGLDKISKLHTKPMERVCINKPVADLFSLPATTSWRRGRPCTWGKPLMKLYSQMACPILRPSCEETRESSEPRDVHVEKSPRLSEWHEADSAMPEDQAETAEDMGNSNVRDRELMPPPSNHPMLSRPSDEQPAGLPAPGESHEQHDRPPSLPSSPQQQLPQQQSPRTPSRQSIPLSPSAVSPRTPRRPTIRITPASDGESHAELPNDSAAMSPSTASTRERSSLMGEHEFYKFLEDLWLEEFQRTSSNKVALERLIPKQGTRITFHRYFSYLQRFQVEGKLTMTQEVIWGLVSIAKGIE